MADDGDADPDADADADGEASLPADRAQFVECYCSWGAKFFP